MLLNTYKYNHTETLHIFTIFVSVSTSRSVYAYLRESIFIFVFIFIMINCIISWIQTCLFFCLFFRICPVIVRWYRGCRMPIVFGCQKFSLRILLSICLIFCQFQPGVANKSVAYRKKKRNEAYFRKASLVLRVSHNTSIQIKLFILPLKKIVEK